MLKVVDKRNSDKHFEKFGELKPGTVFQFRDEIGTHKFYIRTKNHETFGSTICTALPLFGDFDETVALYDAEVEVVKVELHILRGE